MIHGSKKLIWGGAFFVLALAPVFVSAAALGEQVSFFVDSSFDVSGRDKVLTTLRVEGENAHYYVEDEYWQGLGANQAAFASQLQELAKEFDTKIYPLERQGFGFEPNPGIDGDPKITVILTPLIQDAGGYFLLGNEFSKARNLQSNEREMVYLNAALSAGGRWREFLAHEFQHLITYGAKESRIGKNEEIWLNELRSEYAVTLAGYDEATGGVNTRLRAQSFLRTPNDALLHWKNENADYGSVNLFGHYLVQTFGTRILRETLESNAVGIAAIEEVLKSRDISKSFEELYADWLKTNFVGGYRYPILQNFRLTPSVTYNIFGSFSLSNQESVQSWSTKALEVRSGGAGLEITVGAEPSESWLLAVIKRDNASEPLLTYRFTGSKTIHLALQNPNDQNLIILPVNTTDRTQSREGPARFMSYTLTIKTLAEVPAPTPPDTSVSTPVVSTPIPTPTPLSPPTPVPTQTPAPSSPVVSFSDGSLIREESDTRVWIVQGRYVRHISHPAIFGMYGHLRWENVIEVPAGTIARYQISTLVRAADDGRVYEIDGDGVKHWLNLAPEQFIASGRAWEAVYVINNQELAFYRSGRAIMRS